MRWLIGFLLLVLTPGLVRAESPVIVRHSSDGTWELRVRGERFPCAVGRAGVARPGEKREGDGMTPAGEFSFRGLYFRADKVDAASLPKAWHPIALHTDDGWCDESADPQYNRPVKLPYAASHEDLWRSDDVYDLIVPLGYNDDPVVPGRGSAIFFHVALPGYAPTSGCVAVSKEHFLAILRKVQPGDRIRIE